MHYSTSHVSDKFVVKFDVCTFWDQILIAAVL